MIAGLTNKTGDFAFFGSSADMSRIGIGGHSQGAANAAQYGNKPHVQVDMPLADLGGQTVATTSELKSVLVAGGMSDGVVAYSSDTSAYNGSSAPIKRLVGITGGDHLDVTDLCQTNDSGQTAIQVAQAAMVCGAGTLAGLAKCGTGLSPSSVGPQITNYVTTAALEETLHCMDRSAAFNGLKAKYSQVGDFQHMP
jgi:hypothetical protein